MSKLWVRGRCIGKGSFGTVNLARNLFNGKIFAVKSVNLLSSPLMAIEALENEIRCLRSLNSPHIISYLGDDTSYEPGLGWFRNLHIEYLSGGTIAEAANAGTIGEVQLCNYTRSITRALMYLHMSAGMVHGDVKGLNVLIGSDSSEVKLVDFGMAGEGLRGMGTPLWMAPEVARGEVATPSSDVWSLGCTIIEMASGGRLPWGFSGDYAEFMHWVGMGEGLPDIPIGMSKLSRDFLDKCLKRNPCERWSCKELLHHPFLAQSIIDVLPKRLYDWEEVENKNDEGNIIYKMEVERSRRLTFEALFPEKDWGREGMQGQAAY